MSRLEQIKDKIQMLFSTEDVTVIETKHLLELPLNAWTKLNDKEVRYCVVEKSDTFVTILTEWLDDDILYKHLHKDSDEYVFVIAGEIESTMDYIKRDSFGKISYKAGTIHEVKGKKGTLIAVKFIFK